MSCRGTRGRSLRTAMSSLVQRGKFFRRVAPGDVCPSLSHNETHGHMNTKGLNLSCLGCSAPSIAHGMIQCSTSSEVKPFFL